MTAGPAPVLDLTLEQCLASAPLVSAWKDVGGFVAVDVARAAATLRTMLRDEGMTRVISFPAAIVSTGLRGLLRELVERGHFDLVITTCGTLDHDIARTLGHYYQGAFELDDERVAQQGYHRLGSVLVPVDAYGPTVERFVRPILANSPKGYTGTALCRAIGEALAKEPRGGESLLAACARRDVPVLVPALVDGAVGSQVWTDWERTKNHPDLMADQHLLFDRFGQADTLGALMLGGGISKHHTIWWAQFRGGLDAAVYVTTATERDGSLSGARLREAVSWGKLKATASHATVEGEATVVLPLLLAGALA